MKYIKITNLKTFNGVMDYRGLDIDKFISGTQVYSEDFDTFMCATTEVDIAQFNEVVEISHQEWENYKTEREEARTQETLAGEQRIADVEIAIASILGGAL